MKGKIAIVCDDFKVDMFKATLDTEKFSFEVKKFTTNTSIFTINTTDQSKIKKITDDVTQYFIDYLAKQIDLAKQTKNN